MKLSCLPVSLYNDIFSGKKSVADWIQFGSELDLDAVDFSIKFFPDREAKTIKQVRAALDKHNMRTCMVACYSDFTHPDPAQRSQELTDLKADIAFARSLGAEFVRVTAGQNHPGIEREVAVQWVIDAFREAIATAEDLRITLAYENHTKGAPWDYWDFSQPPDIFLEILDSLANTSLGVCFDTANPLVLGGDSLTLLEAIIHRIVILHIFDLREVGGFEAVRVGTGASPIPQIFSRIRQRGYDGWLSIEEASHTGEKGFEQSVAYVRNAWKYAKLQYP